MISLGLKEKIKSYCLEIIQNKIDVLNSALAAAIEATNSETKSTAGDKHETGRAMMQLEQEKLSNQLNELTAQKTELEKLNIAVASPKVIKGSLIDTNQALVFIGTGLGKLEIENKTVYVVSENSPLGKLLLGKSINDSIALNKVTYTVNALI